jgi:hypothetical protein
MTAAENKQRYADYIQAIFNEARFDELDGFLAPDMRSRTRRPDPRRAQPASVTSSPCSGPASRTW